MNTLHGMAFRIKTLCDEKGISINKMLVESEAGARTYHNMLSGSFPSSDKLAKIANYLGCSVDYLLGRTDIREVNQRDNVEIKYYERLNAAGRQKVEEYIRDLSENPKYTKPDTSDDEHPSLLFSLIQRTPKH